MSDPAANCTLELSCTVGSVDNALEALEEGADINFGNGAPLFAAIFNRNNEMVRLLVDQGADLSLLLPASRMKEVGDDPDAIVTALMACAPTDPDVIDPDAMEEMDDEIREKGLGAPVKSGDWDGLVRFAEKLEKIGAPKAQTCVNELIELLQPAQEFGDAALFETIKAEKKKIAEMSERYNEVAEDIANLAQLFAMSSGEEPASAPDASEESEVEEESSSDSNSPGLAAIAV